MAGSGKDLGPCPFCGEHHPDHVLLCPQAEKLLPLEGRILDGKFRFVRMLGEGGMGAVWRAENVLVKKTVAIKLMHVQFSKDEGVLARFRNEATAAGRIGSEHICDILDLGRSDLGPYIVMEMLRGKDLANFLQQRQGAVDPGLSVLIVREALQGLAAAHQVGIIHRDLKPENIFLHEPKPGQLMVKLMDFGISKFTEGSEAGKTGMGVLMGTPEYMSPEQTEGAAQVDQRTDIWAMGVILYWALSGRNPFLGPTMAATLVNVSTREPPPLTALGGHIAPGLVEVIARCIRKDPAERWSSCEQLAQALAPYENRNNGIYVLAGATTQGPSGPGHTMAPAGPPGAPTPAPGATVASPSGVPVGASPTVGGMGAPPGMQPSPTGPAAAPTFGGGASAGPSTSPTWSNEFPAASTGAPATLGGGGFGLSHEQIERRPDSSLGGGGKGGMIVLVLLLLAAVGAGGWFAYQKSGSPSANAGGDDEVAKTEASAGSEPSGPDDGAVAAAGSGGDEPGGGDPAASSAGPGAGAQAGTGTETSGEADGGATAEDQSPTASGDNAADDDDDGGDGGGSNRPKPNNKAKPDPSKVRKVGSLYAPKTASSATTYSSAKDTCAKLKKQRFGNLRGWKIPSSGELNKFVRVSPSARTPLRFWLSSGQVWNNQKGNTARVMGNRVPGARVLCVSR